MTFAVNNRLVDSACGDAVVARGMNARKPLIVSQVEVGLKAVLRYVALTVLVGVQRTGVDVDIRIELLDGHLIAPRLQQLAY